MHDEPQPNSSPSFRIGFNVCLDELSSSAEQHVPVLVACEHSLEGVLCGIGLSYLAHLPAEDVRLCSHAHAQPMLGERLVVAPDSTAGETIALARRVYDGLEQAVSQGCQRKRNDSCPAQCPASCVRKIVYACASDSPSMPEVVHRYVRFAFSQGPKARGLTSNERVAALDDLARSTLNECERTRQFVRFKELSDGSFIARFRPKANTVPLVAQHFANRMRLDRFCLVDPVHGIGAFHERNAKGCRLTLLDDTISQLLVNRQDFTEKEAYVQKMWRQFYNSLELPGRDASQRGYDLRTKWMPKRFWPDLPEMQ